MTITTSLKSFARRAVLSLAYLALFLAAGTSPASAEQVIFTIDPSQSSLDFSTVDSTLGPLLPQYPGSLTTTVSGHFLLSFDPLSDTPATIQFLGTNNGYPNNGYFQDGSNNLGLPGAAPGLSMTTPEPANFAGTTVGGEDVLVYRNLVWDFSSPTISGASGSFPATTTSFYVRQGELDTLNGLNGVRKSYDQTGVIDALTTGSWTLSQSAPGSGNWTLTFNGTYTSSNYGGHPNSATFGGSMMATAHFGAANVTTVPQPAGAPRRGAGPGRSRRGRRRHDRLGPEHLRRRAERAAGSQQHGAHAHAAVGPAGQPAIPRLDGQPVDQSADLGRAIRGELERRHGDACVPLRSGAAPARNRSVGAGHLALQRAAESVGIWRRGQFIGAHDRVHDRRLLTVRAGGGRARAGDG